MTYKVQGCDDFAQACLLVRDFALSRANQRDKLCAANHELLSRCDSRHHVRGSGCRSITLIVVVML